MKLGICYMVFDGEELLPFAVKAIRGVIDHISVTYQTTSYFGNKGNPLPTLEALKAQNLVDELIFYEPNLKIHHKDNELILRNIGLEASRRAGCTHHISADVDEFYQPHQLEYAKNNMGDYNMSLAQYAVYYKQPTWRVMPDQKCMVTFIHPVSNQYDRHIKFPHHLETTRRLVNYENYKHFTKDEIMIHHMSYVRNDIRKKFANNDNKNYYRVEKFLKAFDEHKLGDRVNLIPDYINRRTREVENIFGIILP